MQLTKFLHSREQLPQDLGTWKRVLLPRHSMPFKEYCLQLYTLGNLYYLSEGFVDNPKDICVRTDTNGDLVRTIPFASQTLINSELTSINTFCPFYVEWAFTEMLDSTKAITLLGLRYKGLEALL